MKMLHVLTALAVLPLPALAQTTYGYQKQETITTDSDGRSYQSTVEKTWATPSNESLPTDTPQDAAANARLGYTAEAPMAGDDDMSAEGQKSKAWYDANLEPNARYVLDPVSGKLMRAENSTQVQRLNAEALQKATER